MGKKNRYKSYSRTCETCGCDISHLPNHYTRCEDCFTPYSSYSGSRSSTSGLKRCLKCGGILTTEQYKKGYDYHLECYLKLKK